MTSTTSPPKPPGNHDPKPPKDEHTNLYERPPHKPRNRLIVLVIVVLLIALPAGYLVQSAFQSRDSGRDKERAAAAASLTYERPPRVSQRIYNVPVPPRASRVAFYEDNSWDKSTMWVQFRTSQKRLKEFMNELGSDYSAFERDRPAISGKQAREVGWRLDEPGHRYWGALYEQRGSEPDVAVVADMTYENRPRVYVVSTTEF